MVRPDRQKANRSELFIAAFGRKSRGGGHRGTLDRKIPYLTIRHTPRALEKRAPRTLASLPWARYRPAIRWRLVSDVRAKPKPTMNLGTPITPHDRLPGDNEYRSRCYVDLYRESNASWRPKARKIRGLNTIIGVEAKTRGRWSKDHLGVDRYDSFRTMWSGKSVDIAVSAR